MANDVSTDDSNVDLRGRTWQIAPPFVGGDSDQQINTTASTDPQGRKWEVADEGGTFSSGQFVLDNLKHLDIETASLLDLDRLVSQLLKTVKNDGIWDKQKVLSIPIVGHPPTNLTTEVGLGTGEKPIEQSDLLFSPEVALFAAQLAHELDKRLLFTENLAGVYIREPNEILENWLEENENNFSVNAVERKDHWEHVLTALNDTSEALKIALADEENEAEAEEQVESEADQKEKKDASDDDIDIFHSSDRDEDEAVGSKSGELSPAEQAHVDIATTARRIPTTSPQDIMRAFLLAGGGETGKASNTDYLKQLQGLGFSAQDRRLIVDQTAWIYAGVLAQVFPNAVGQFDTLDPVARAQINQLVRDYIMQLPDRQAILASLIANPLGRRDLILDILQKNSPLLSSLSLRSEEKFNTSISLNSREDTIAQQVPELAAFLTQHAAAEGVVLTSEQANVDAYNELSKLTAAQLRGLSAGLLPVREKIFESAAKSTAQATLALALSQAADISIESIDFQNIILSLDAVVLNLATTGLSIEQIEAYLSGLSAEAFLALIGVTPQSPLYKAYLENIQQIRQAALFYIREKQLVLRLNESRVKKKQEGDELDERANHIAHTALGEGAIFSASSIHQSGKATSEVAAELTQSTSNESKAYNAHYLKEWNILTIDQQSVVYLLTKGGVDGGYLKQNPKTDPLQFPDEYIDIESEVQKDYFQEFVLEFSLDRGAYKSPQKVQQLRARFESQSGIQIGEIKRANHMAHSALGVGATFSASTLHQPPKETSKATVELKQSIASKAEAYQKHFVDGWEVALSNDERVMAVLVTTGLVDNKYLSPNPSTDHPPMPREYLEIESEIKKPYFQALVAQFSRDRSAYKSAKKKQELLASFASKSSGELVRSPTPTTTQYQQAKAFEDKYRAIWNSLTHDEKVAMYVIAGASFKSGQELKPIIAIVDYADAIGTPEFNSLVAIIAQNPTAVDTSGGQAEIATAIATIGANTSTSQAIAQERMADVAATQQMLAEMSESEQTALATQYGYADAASLVAGQQDQAQLLGGQASPEELAVAAQNPRAIESLSRFRRSSASGTSIPGFKTFKQKAKDVGKKVTAAADKAVQAALKFAPGVGLGLSAMWASGKPGKVAVGVIVTPYLAALSTPLGALGAVAGGVIGGLVGGPIGASLGSYTLGLSGLWLNHQMGLGSFFNVRTPPSPWEEPIIQSAYPSTAVTNAAATSEGGAAQVVVAKPAAAVGITKSASAIWSVVAMPAYALLGVFVTSVFVMTIIWGAFIAPSVSEGLPTNPINEATQPAAKYATITKTASPDVFDNPTGGQTYATKYAISIQPKPGFKLKITNVNDVYSSFGKKPAPTLTSPLTFDRLSQELITHIQGATPDPNNPVANPNMLLVDEFAMEYDQSGITGEDAYLVNKITLTFDVYNYLSDKPVESNQSYTTSASIIIGKPQVGCWPTNGVITSVPFAGIVTHQGSDAFDIAAPLGEPITSPFVGTACNNHFNSGGYGNYVRLFVDGLDVGQGGGTLQFIFGHLNSYSPELASSAASCQLDGSRNLISGGVPVVPGSLLGFVGSTGNSTGPHLHYELYSNYHGGLTGGVYSSLLRLLMPAGPNTQLYDSIQGCSAL